MLQLIEKLQQTRGAGIAGKDHIAFLNKLVDDYKQMVTESLDACQDWKEMAYEDSPLSKDYLNPANLALRLERPHKSN
jgi:hypothetical protein